MSELTLAAIKELDDAEITAAFVRPPAPFKVLRIFQFLTENENLTTTVSGMTSLHTGLNRHYLSQVARDMYKIDLSKWTFAVRWFEQGILKRQESML